jgi:hypothetical protein
MGDPNVFYLVDYLINYPEYGARWCMIKTCLLFFLLHLFCQPLLMDQWYDVWMDCIAAQNITPLPYCSPNGWFSITLIKVSCRQNCNMASELRRRWKNDFNIKYKNICIRKPDDPYNSSWEQTFPEFNGSTILVVGDITVDI